MVLHFNVKGESRKAMVKAIEKEIGGKAKYLGVPSCAYEIGNFTVGKNGELEFGDFDDLDEVAPIVDACVLATGVSPAEWENNATEEENADTGATEGENEPTCDGVSISVPRAASVWLWRRIFSAIWNFSTRGKACLCPCPCP